MAKLDKVAGRYAKALFDFLGDATKAKSVAEELTSLGKMLSENNELTRALTSQVFSTDKRLALLKDVADKSKVSDETKRFLMVLGENNRVDAVSDIAGRLHLLYLQNSQVEPIQVETAVSLSDSEKTAVEKKFGEILGRKVEANYVLEKGIYGGLKVSAAGRTYDGTLKGWLEVMEEKLIGGRV